MYVSLDPAVIVHLHGRLTVLQVNNQILDVQRQQHAEASAARNEQITHTQALREQTESLARPSSTAEDLNQLVATLMADGRSPPAGAEQTDSQSFDDLYQGLMGPSSAQAGAPAGEADLVPGLRDVRQRISERNRTPMVRLVDRAMPHLWSSEMHLSTIVSSYCNVVHRYWGRLP